MARNRSDRLIDTGRNQAHFLGVTALVTLTGLMYVAFLLPAYDPAVLAQPGWLTYGEYLMLFLGGLMVFVSLFLLPDRIWALKGQFFGLGVQVAASVVTVVTVTAYGGSQGLFIITFGVLVVIMHTVRMVTVYRDVRQAPERRRVAEMFPLPLTSGDAALQIIHYLESRIAELEAQRGR